jgi:hypothetical protein
MAIWAFVNDTHTCAKCRQTFVVPKEFKYGHVSHGHHFKYGDSVYADGKPFYGGLIRDSLLKYYHLGSGILPCQRADCGGDAVGSAFIYIEAHVITGGLKACAPSSSAVAALGGAADWVEVFSPLEMALLTETHGCDRTYAALDSLGTAQFGKNWGKRFAELKNRIPTLAESWAQNNEGRSFAEFQSQPAYLELKRSIDSEFPAVKWSGIRTALLNHLSRKEAATPSIANQLRVAVKCQGCSEEMVTSVAFDYGPSGGHAYSMGDSIDWNLPGSLSVVRDPRAKYVPIDIPQCRGCGHAGYGVVSVIRDVISDFFVFPSDLLRELREWRKTYPSVKELEPAELVVFVGIREYGADAVRQALSAATGAYRFQKLAEALNRIVSS